MNVYGRSQLEDDRAKIQQDWKKRMNPDLRAIMELVEELGYRCSVARGPADFQVKTLVYNEEVVLVRHGDQFMASDVIPGLPMEFVGEGYLRYKIAI
jgi:hypothetical protein